MEINGYLIQGELNNANSGFSKWGFAEKNSHLYFIKELITPVYPIDDSAMSGPLLEQRRDFCHQFEDRYRKIYSIINDASCGNLVRIVDFFRWGGKYYVVSERAGDNAISVKNICTLPDIKKYFLMKSAAYCFACFHKTGLVHFDVKPTNIIIKETSEQQYVAKLIDFDAGFLKEEIRDDIELGGDLTYLAPESFLHIYGEDVKLDEKVDIFSLGLVFHEYYCGKLPYYDNGEFDYPYEAALELGGLEPDYNSLPDKLGKLIGAMLNLEPSQRPSAQGIVDTLSEIIAEEEGGVVFRTAVPSVAAITVADVPAASHSGGWFETGGDL